MKKFIFAMVGAILLGAICIGITWAVGNMSGNLPQGEDEASRNFTIFIVAFFASVITGAVSGFKLGRRR